MLGNSGRHCSQSTSCSMLPFLIRTHYLNFNSFTEDVPLVIVLKAMGMESDQEIVQLIGSSHPFNEMCVPSIEDCQVCVNTSY